MPDPQARARHLFDVDHWGYKRIGRELELTVDQVRELLGAAPRARTGTRARDTPQRDPGSETREEFLEAELLEALEDRRWMRTRKVGQAIEANRRSIRMLRQELDAARSAGQTGGLVDVEEIILTVLELDDAILNEVERRRGLLQ